MTATERENIEDRLQFLFQVRARLEQEHLRIERGSDEHYQSVERLCNLNAQILALRCELNYPETAAGELQRQAGFAAERARQEREWDRTGDPEGEEPIAIERQFGRPHNPPTFWQQIEQALLDAGYRPGRQHRGSGWSDDGPLIYEPPIAGYVIDGYRDYALPDPYRHRFAAIDHAGQGQKAAIDRYEEVLRAAGFNPRRKIKRYGGKKEVLLVEVPDAAGEV